ncbi:MAG: D-amino acid dehydrogenase [Rhodospirillales bacterium]|nr:D-amino acid dehydrogenase [Rhodospirillales bacterium]
MRTLVLGAGVIGVASAYYLAKAGHQVVVIDRQNGAGMETSFANGGQISASHADPWAGPGTPLKALKWLGRENAPLIVRARFDPALWSWLLRFLGNCTSARSEINTERILRVAVYARDKLAQLRDETGIEYDHEARGILHVYSDKKEFDQAVPKAGLMSELGCIREVLDVDGCIEREPALARSRDKLVGGTFSPDDESGDAYLFTSRLADLCRQMGVQFRYRTNVLRFVAGGDRIMGVVTEGGTLTSEDYDMFVLALGSYSSLLLKSVGISLPVYPAKGYSVTIPVGASELAPHVAISDDERKIVYSRLGDRLRVAGTAELAGYDSSLRDSRARSILDAAMDLFPDCGDAEAAEFWAGLRPTTPDSVPVMGPTRFGNLLLNTGHGTLGWTMCAGSGRIIADLASGKSPEIDLDGLGIDRFA